MAFIFLVICLAMLFTPVKVASADSKPAPVAGSGNVSVVDMGEGKYRIGGVSYGIGSTYAYYENIPVPSSGRVYISVDMIEYPYFDDADSWLAFTVGSSMADWAYGPSSEVKNDKGPYYSQLMRFNRMGSVSGNYFQNGVVKGDFTTMSTANFEIMLSYVGSNVKVYLNGVEDKSFITADSSTCNLGFTWYSTDASVFKFDVTVSENAVCADIDYDISTKSQQLNVPLKLMSANKSDIKLFDENAEVDSSKYTVVEEDGLYYLRIDTSLFSADEGDTRKFYVQSLDTRSSFTITTVDNSIVKVSNESYNKKNGGLLNLIADIGTLKDVKLFDENGADITSFVNGRAINFPEDYILSLSYGVHEFSVQGTKVSGNLSDINKFSVNVYDSRLPVFESTSFEYDCSQTDNISFSFTQYDANILCIYLNGKPVTGYCTVTNDAIVMDNSVLSALPYGESTVLVSTDKCDVTTILRKTDSRTPSIENSVFFDRNGGGEYIVVPATWYAFSVQKVMVGTVELKSSAYTQVVAGLKIFANAISDIPDGAKVQVVGESSTLEFNLVIIDSSAPKVETVHGFDLAYGRHAEVHFNANKNVQFEYVNYFGSRFDFVKYENGVLYISAEWFKTKMSAGVLTPNDIVEFEIVWTNTVLNMNCIGKVFIPVYDSNSFYGSIPALNKANGQFSVPVILNGYEIYSIKLNGEYVQNYQLLNDKSSILLPSESILSQSVGNVNLEINTQSYSIVVTLKVIDTRSAKQIGEAKYYTNERYKQGFLYPVELYENSVYYIKDANGSTIPSYMYSVTKEGIVFENDYFKDKQIGRLNFFVGTRRTVNGITTQEELSFYLLVSTKSELTISGNLSCDKLGIEGLELNVSFGSTAFVGIKVDGTVVADSWYSRLGREKVVISQALLNSLSVGKHTLTIISTESTKDVEITITDGRVNSFSTHSVSLNPKAQEIILKANIVNENYYITLNGKRLIENKDYIEDSGYIVLKSALIGSLGSGKHSLKIEGASTDEAIIEIYDNSVSYTLPIVISIGSAVVLCTAIAVMLILASRRKKNESEK